MYQLFSRVNTFDNSPYQYARLTYLKSRVDENYQKLVAARKTSTGRLDSSHLLITLLNSLSVEFTGDLSSYMDKVETQAKSLCSSLGIVASFNRGRLMTESVFYPGCPEIVTYSRSSKWTIMDLWKDWRSVTPIEVVCHPITDLTVAELCVKNEMGISKPGLAIINIDIPLLAAQWKMWQSSHPERTKEEFLTTVPLVGAVKSHLDVVMFNKVQRLLDIIPDCPIKTNLTFAQAAVEQPGDELIAEAVRKITEKSLTPNQSLASIPALYGKNYLDSVQLPSVTPTYQILWALIAQKMAPAAVCLELAKNLGYDRMLDELRVIKRTLITNAEDKTLSNGLTSATAELLKKRMESLVIRRLPE